MVFDLTRYEEKIDTLFRMVPSFQKVGKEGYHPGIETMKKFDDFLLNPHRDFKVIHVAGTNGKGSVSSMLASVLMGMGYRVGLYTSPHLVDFRERIKVDGQMISKEAVLDFLDRAEEFIAENDPSFFEITTEMAFDYFAGCEVDYAVVECGLGGRLDSTNIVIPVLSVITSIGLDHTDILGDTEEKIAYEKGGIIKPGVPVVVGQVSDSVAAVLDDIASEVEAEIFFAETVVSEDSRQRDLRFASPSHLNKKELLAEDIHRISSDRSRPLEPRAANPSDENPSLTYSRFIHSLLDNMDLKGDYQRENLATVLLALDVLTPQLEEQGTDMYSDEALSGMMESIFHAAQRTGFRGRWEVLSEKPFVVCDIAHNPHGMRPVMEQLKRVCSGAPKLYFIFGVMSDKDLDSISGYLPPRAHYFYTAANSPRAMSPQKLSEWMSGRGFTGEVSGNVESAVKQCLSQATENDVVYIGGSSYVVAEALKLF